MIKSGIRLILIVLFLSACNTSAQRNREYFVQIQTSMGDIKIRLYNETPQHRDNFLQLVRDKFYDGVLFHRVIDSFMIQAGDPESVGAEPGVPLGNGGPGYTVPAEFHPQLFHKKGVLSAARQGDQFNPDQESSGSQFYIVEGKTFSDSELVSLEKRINSMKQQNIFYKHLQKEIEENEKKEQQLDNNRLQQNAMLKTQEALLEYIPYSIPDYQREVYKTLGGTPHLDMSYTVFGEVVEGLDVLEAISSVKTDDRDRPLVDIDIKMKVVRR